MEARVIFVDTHAHLPMLVHSPPLEVLARARSAGVTRVVTVATEVSNWESSRQFALGDPNIWYTLGLHPHSASDWAHAGLLLENLFENGTPARCVGIGETGLDFQNCTGDRDTQVASLEGQLVHAKRHCLPVILHCREAFADLFASIRKVGLSPSGGVMHCFTGTGPDAKAALDLGLKISFSGILTFKNAESLRMAARTIPLSEIVLETDCPFLAPVPHRGKPCEPSFLPQTALVLANTLGLSLDAVAEQTTLNARNLFGL